MPCNSKQYNAAIRLFKKANKAYSRGWEAYEQLGHAYFNSGQNFQALQAYKKATRYTRKARLWLKIGQMEYKQKKYSRAKKSWEKAKSRAKGAERKKAEKYLKMVAKKL